SLRCDCPSRGGRRKIVFELRICPARHFVAATHEPTRSGAFPLRLQCIERSADEKARRNSQTPQDRSVCIPHSNFHGILAKARLSRPHRRETQGRVHPGKSSNLRNRQRAAQPPALLGLRSEDSSWSDGCSPSEGDSQWRIQNPRAKGRCRWQRHRRDSSASHSCSPWHLHWLELAAPRLSRR